MYIISPCIFDWAQSDQIQFKTLIKTNQTQSIRINLTWRSKFTTDPNTHRLKHTQAATYTKHGQKRLEIVNQQSIQQPKKADLKPRIFTRPCFSAHDFIWIIHFGHNRHLAVFVRRECIYTSIRPSERPHKRIYTRHTRPYIVHVYCQCTRVCVRFRVWVAFLIIQA